MTLFDTLLTADLAAAQDVIWVEPFDSWARSHNLIPVGSQLVFVARKDGKTRLFLVDMSVPLDIPDGMDPETFMRDAWLASAEVERGRCRALGWACDGSKRVLTINLEKFADDAMAAPWPPEKP